MSTHHSIFEDQARELYNLCDEEEKGYIQREDMYRLKSHLPLDDQQLIAVFESLDADGNGTLTIDEFIMGFGKFLGANFDSAIEDESDPQNETVLQDAKEHLQHLLDHVSNTGLSEDLELIKETWCQLQNNPELLTVFENLIENIVSDMTKSKTEYQSLANLLKNKTSTYEEEIKQLYDELDNQVKTEKEKILMEERQKELQLKAEIENQIKMKDDQLQRIQKEHEKIKAELQTVMETHGETNQEHERLERDKLLLEEKLNSTDKSLRDCQEYIEDLNRKAKQDKRKRARAAIEMTEGIALERESLVRQLDELKELNKKLLAEKQGKTKKKAVNNSDEGTNLFNELAQCDKPVEKIIEKPVEKNVKSTLEVNDYLKKKRGSILSSYFTPIINVDNEVENEVENVESINEIYVNESLAFQQNDAVVNDAVVNDVVVNDASYYTAESNTSVLTLNTSSTLIKPLEKCYNEIEIQTEKNEESLGERSPPDGAGDDIVEYTSIPEKPERIYKIVLIGDSSVGKTSILKRFCHEEFKEDGIASTIGVDFQIRSIRVDGYFVALQLWDTAGQERFRSITTQYYRKADGVILVYDLSNEVSFLNLRQWMVNVKDAVEEGTAIMILGNKSDKIPLEELDRTVSKFNKSLDLDNETLIYHCSAKTGLNILEAFHALSKILTSKENDDLKTVLNINNNTKKGCCGRK